MTKQIFGGSVVHLRPNAELHHTTPSLLLTPFMIGELSVSCLVKKKKKMDRCFDPTSLAKFWIMRISPPGRRPATKLLLYFIQAARVNVTYKQLYKTTYIQIFKPSFLISLESTENSPGGGLSS